MLVPCGDDIYQAGPQICACNFGIGQISLKVLLVFSFFSLKKTTFVKIGQNQLIGVLFVHLNNRDVILFDLQFRRLS